MCIWQVVKTGMNMQKFCFFCKTQLIVSLWRNIIQPDLLDRLYDHRVLPGKPYLEVDNSDE